MASENVQNWILKNQQFIGTSVLEVGSKSHKAFSTINLDEIIKKRSSKSSLLRCDIDPGENVDLILDVTSTEASIATILGNVKFDTIFCISVLEHIHDIFSACKNLSNLLNPGGSIFLSVPFVFRYHGYPDDFWRFTPNAVVKLFPEINFQNWTYSIASSLTAGDVMSLAKINVEKKLNRFAYRPKDKTEKEVRKIKKREGIQVEYSLTPILLNLLGFKN